MANFTMNLIEKFTFGQVLLVAGETMKDCNNYKVNFASENEDEIVLTIFVNVRVNEIVMNSFLDGKWREAVKFNVASLTDRKFKFYILAGENELHIAFNDQHLCKYSLEILQFVDIKSVKVSGEITKVAQVDHRQIFPTCWPPIIEDLKTIGFSSDVPRLFSPGSVVVIRMEVSGDENGSFFIRFNDRATPRQLFHFNPRFADRKVIVNCMNDSHEWLNDEYRHNIFPFELNKEFQLAIAIGTCCFKVAIDGRHLLTYDFKSVKRQMPNAFTGHHQIFDKLTGFKIFGLLGMKVQVSLVDHIQAKEDLTFYEIFSNPSYGK